MITLNKKLLEKIKAYFASQEDILLVYLYGSQAKGTAKVSSDIDLAILTKKNGRDPFDIQIDAMDELVKITKREVEVQNLRSVEISFAHRVISEGKLLFARSLEDKVSYETYVLRTYFDLKPLYKEFYTVLEQRARLGIIGQPTVREGIV